MTATSLERAARTTGSASGLASSELRVPRPSESVVAELCGSTVVVEGREGLVQRSSGNGHPDRYWVVCAEREWCPLDPSLATVVRRCEEVSA